MTVPPPVPPQGDRASTEPVDVFDEERLARAAAEQVAQRLRRLQEVGTELLGALTVDAVVRVMVERGLSLLGAVAGAVWMVEPSRRLSLRGHVGYPDDVIDRFTDVPLDSPAPSAEAARTGARVTLLSVAERDERYPHLVGGSTVGAAFLCEPLAENGQVLGVLSASFADGALLGDPANLAFIDTVVAQCSVALHRAHTIQGERASRLEAEQALRRLGRLQEFTARLVDIDDVQELTAELLAAGVAETGAIIGLLAAVDGDVLRVVHAQGIEAAAAARWQTFDLDPGYPAADAVLRRTAVVLRGRAERDARYPRLAGAPPEDDHVLACFPVGLAERAFGVLTLTFPGLDVDAERVRFLQSLADQCAHALERARLVTVETRARARLEVLAEAGRLFAAATDIDALCSDVCRLAVGGLADIATVLLVGDDDEWEVVSLEQAGAHVTQANADLVRSLPDRGGDLLHASLRSARPRLIRPGGPDYERLARDPELAGLLRDLDVGSGLVLPLRAHGNGLGVLVLATLGGRAPLDEADLSEMTELASRLALALDNARLFRQQSEIARTLQRSLLPVTNPEVPGAEVATSYLPGTDGLTVGGDFYDVVPLPSGRTGLVVGDVMGRGVKAAAVMGQVRAAIRSYVLEGHGPADLLGRLDRLVSSLDDALIVTCCYAEWDAEQHSVVLACAGHPPPLVMAAGGTVPAFLAVDPGVPLGVGDGSYVEQQVSLPPGSLLLAYTDGLVESPDLPVDEGMRRLAAAVAGARSAAAACAAALETQPTSDDDVAMLALWTQPVPADDGHWVGEVVRDLAPDIHSPARARAAVEHALLSWGLPGLVDTAVLLVSELVTNAVRHAGTSVLLRVVRLSAERVRVEVVDHSPHTRVHVRPADARAEGGRGLQLVGHLAHDWGTVAGETTKTVWFEL